MNSKSNTYSNYPFKIRLSLKSEPPNKRGAKAGGAGAGGVPNNYNHVLTITPSMSMLELENTIYDKYNVAKKEQNEYDLELYSGFPPKRIEFGGGSSSLSSSSSSRASSSAILVSSCIGSGENVTLKFCPKQKQKQKQSTKKSSQETTESNLDIMIRSRPKRAAANAASASFKDVIKEQDDILNKERSRAKRATATKRKAINSNKNNNNQDNYHKKRKAAAEERAAAANSRRLASLPGGRALNSDDNNNRHSNSNSSIKHTKKAPNIFKEMTNEEDISFALLSSVNNPGSSGKKVSKVLRSAMRRTVEKSYEASRAVVRCSAIASGDISFLNPSSSTSPSSLSPSSSKASVTMSSQGTCNDIGTFHVLYPKGIEGIGYYEDKNIHIISIETLKAVITSVYESNTEGEDDITVDDSGREMLKPSNMALLSPRVFWSLWYHYKDNCKSMEEALKTILPHLNWNFLSKRSRILSEKARENLRQRQQNVQEIQNKVAEVDHHGNNYEAKSIKAVKDVEDAMENMYQKRDVSSLRARAAEAALLRIKSQYEQKAGKIWDFLHTPTEVDLDELKECISEAAILENKPLTNKHIDTCAKFMLSRLSINNWRMLANVQIKDISTKISSSLSEIDECMVGSIISAAQRRTIEEIMLEIVNGNEDVYHILRLEASSATPQDLTLWKMIPSMLIEEAPSLVNKYEISEKNVLEWCSGAELAMERYEWLPEFSTSVL